MSDLIVELESEANSVVFVHTAVFESARNRCVKKLCSEQNFLHGFFRQIFFFGYEV